MGKTQLYTAVQAKRRKLRKEFDIIADYLVTLGENSPFFSNENEDRFNFDNFIWADTMFRSRVFGIPSKNSPSEKVDGMIPFLDSLNHDPDRPSVNWRIGENTNQNQNQEENLENQVEIEEDPKFVYLIANYDLKDGEITVNYGDKGNEELLFQYGFSLKDNPNDSAMFLPPIFPDSDPLFEGKIGLLNSLGLGPRIIINYEGVNAKSLEIASKLCS